MGAQCACCGLSETQTELFEGGDEQRVLDQDPGHGDVGDSYIGLRDMRKDGILGTSSIGNVVKTTHRNGKEIYVVKQMNKKCMEGMGWKEDVQALQSLEHPHICRVSHAWEDTMSVYLVMEFCQGGSLISLARHTDDGQNVNEAVISVFVRQMVDALNHFHEHKLVHGDIRPEKWLFSNDASVRKSMLDNNLKMINFGLSRKFGRRSKDEPMYVPKTPPTRESERRGSSSSSRKYSTTLREERNLNCRAPEQLAASSHLDEKVDVWALGVITYFLLSGQSPWAWAGYKEEIVKKAMYTFMPAELWRPISSEAKNFIALCLQENVERRPTAQKCLQLPWMQLALAAIEEERAVVHGKASPLMKKGIRGDPLPTADRVVATFRRLDHLNSLEKACVITTAHRVPASGFETLAKQLAQTDPEGTGVLRADRLFDVLRDYGVPIQDLKHLGRVADSELRGPTMQIDYIEFLRAVDECQRNMQDSAIWAVFRSFDDGAVSKRRVCEILKKGSTPELVQEKFPEVSLEGVVEDLSKDGDASISPEELKKLLRAYRVGGLGIASASTSDRTPNSPKSDRNSERTSVAESTGQKSML
mmetsp:Transcript_52150/g.124251  ORF Transcript_52150/g.124251 Transcript_52150/m.124251 type:complete len:589 (-) Transcript_52150:158-1924(-)|eukprot:CAMPEP_0178387648 /NCGR_PEP_ID=MMETSP0689_2-20121128/9181_1 /TAXON_ID=160604 /ORGANISM="Amphidinium massartii, Strain CS-259" /LENGTH=588 /DNA_ID=CAMNT_0020008017 /DNA_START=50 /DNA_END=1816 /DNA_ORIENTATION=+